MKRDIDQTGPADARRAMDQDYPPGSPPRFDGGDRRDQPRHRRRWAVIYWHPTRSLYLVSSEDILTFTLEVEHCLNIEGENVDLPSLIYAYVNKIEVHE